MEIKNPEMKELIVHHVYKVDNEELAKLCVSTSNAMQPLFWHDGIMFFFQHIPLIMNAEIIHDYMNGKEHWEEAYYSEVETYKENIEIENGSYKGAKIRVINVSDFTPHKEFVAWIKKQKMI